MAVICEAFLPVVSRWARPGEPLSIACPLAQGRVSDPGRLTVMDTDTPLPTQAQVTSWWPDGSLRWVILHTVADLPGLAAKTLRIVEDQPPAPHPTPLKLQAGERLWQVETGPLSFRIDTAEGFRGPQSLTFAGAAWPLSCGPVRLDLDGRHGATESAADWSILETGPVRAVVQAVGRFTGLGEAGPSYRARLTAWAGRPELVVELTVIQDTDHDELPLSRLSFALEGPPRLDLTMRLGESNYQCRVREARPGQQTALSRVIDADDLVYSSNEQVAELFHTDLFVDYTPDDAPGVTATIHQPFQQYPKALTVTPSGITVELLPEIEGGTGPIVLRQGQAKTHRLQLAWHAPDASQDAIKHRSLLFQMPDEPVLPRSVYLDAGVFAEQVFPARTHLRCESYANSLGDNRCRAYGWLHWGDGPDWGYTQQGRGKGALVWTNNEYDLPHVAYLHYVNTGERRYRAMAEVAAQHWIDVDVVHHHREARRVGGQVIHSAWHVSGGLTPCHEWVQGLLDYHHFTGRPEALDAAKGIAAHVMGVLETNEALKVPGAAAARVTGWALRTLVAMYLETSEARYLAPSSQIVDGFLAWHAQYGGFLAPYHSHTLCRVPFMIAIACGSLYRYHRAVPDERVAKLIPHEMEALIDTCLRPDGRWVYKDLPSLHRRGAGHYVLEALAYAWDLTGDRKFLIAGLPELEATIAGSRSGGRGGGTTHRQHLPEEQTVLYGNGPGPKEYASQWLPIMTYYRALAAADLLPPDVLDWLPGH